MIPLLVARIVEEEGVVSDAILQAAFDGRLKTDEGGLVTTGTLATLTAGVGKDLYLVRATADIGGRITTDNATITLNNNGTAVEICNVLATVNTGNNGPDGIKVYPYSYVGKVTTGLAFTLTAVGSSIQMNGFLMAIEVPTGENPVTYEGS